MRSITDLVRLLAAYVRLNLAAQLEYRGAFLSQVIAMFINDGIWVIFWVVFFDRFPVLRGWTREDVITVWAITAAGFGLAFAMFGNSLWLATFITQGQLDTWLLYPRPVLPHLLVSKMLASAWGDALFGFFTYILFVHPSIVQLFMFICLTLSVAMLFVGFCILVSSFGFFLGNAVALLDQGVNALITFSTYPAVIFDGGVKLILFTLIPAAFVSYLPVEALRQLSPGIALLSTMGAVGVLSVGVLVFYRGLRRYESGNLMEMRG
ncbi:MAG: ABC-2 family transporter protein [Anaerolineae bacterium]|nr:ABC-2 family transporter protein [Anaerolineae bacterium]